MQSLVSIICGYATFRFLGVVKMPGYLTFPLLGLGFSLIAKDTFPTSYLVSDASRQLISKVKMVAKRNPIILKSLNSCKMLGINVAFYFTIKQSTIMIYFRIVIENTITLLLTF